nr:unnamed protein product [Digitaria exilis]
MPSSSPPRIRRRPKKTVRLSLKAFQSWQPPSGRDIDWASELPMDLILHVFHLLDPVELLRGGAMGACRSWRRATRDEPMLWRHLDMRGYDDPCRRSHVPFLVFLQAAVRRSQGQVEAFWADYCDDDVLLFLAEQEYQLKSLRLIRCGYFTNKGLLASMMKFPHLEELELSACNNIYGQEVFSAIAISCPRLKHLRNIKSFRYEYETEDDDSEAIAIASMCELYSLELHNHHPTNKTLMTILDSCTQLELLILRDCPKLRMDDTLLAKCARVKIVTLRGDDYVHCKITRYRFRPWSSACNPLRAVRESHWDDLAHLVDGFFPEDIEDYIDYSRYLNGVYVTDLDDDEDSRMLVKSMRRYLKINTGV